MAKKTIINKPILDDSQKKSPLTDEQILKFLNRGNGLNGSTAADLGAAGLYGTRGDDYLMQLLYQQYITSKDTGANADELNAAIYKEMLAYFKMLEQRGYDKDALNEQRQYDSPISQLMRLMSTGMSRDAAIQALTGGQDAALVGSGAGTETTPTLSPQEVRSQQIQNGLGIFNAAVGTLGTIGQLTSLGFSIPQAIHQTQVTKAAATMSQEQVKAYQSVNAVTSALDTFGNSVGSIADLQGLTNADDAYKFMQDHQDSALFKPLFDSGAINGTFGNTIGREMFNNFWREKFSSETEGQRLLRQVHKEDFETNIAGLTAASLQKQLEFFFNTEDERYTEFENSVRRGEIEVRIANNLLRVNDIETDAYVDAMNTQYGGKTGRQYLTWNQVYGLYEAFKMNEQKFGNTDSIKKFEKMVKDDFNFACKMAYIKSQMSSDLSSYADDLDDGMNRDFGQRTKLYTLLGSSGLLNSVSVEDAASTTAGVVGTGAKVIDIIF